MKCFDIHNIIYLFFILISHLRNGVNSSADLVCQNESKCNCLCDVNSGTCDFNCCCDADCTSEEIEFFTFPCGEETNAKKTNDKRAQVKIAKCDEKKSKSNIKTSDFDLKRLSDFVEDEISGLLCVKYDNSAVTGAYFDDNDMSAKIMEKEMKRNDFNFMKNDILIPNSITDEGGYLIGDHIPTIVKSFSNDTTSSYTFKSTLSLPGPGDGGLCSSTNAVRFGIDTKRSCFTRLNNLESSCKQNLNIRHFINDIQVLKVKGLVYSSIIDSDVNDIIVNITIMSLLSREGHEFNSTDHLMTFWDNDSEMCYHALKSLKYEIYYDSNGTIIDAKANILSMNVGNDSKTLKQNFEIKFIPALDSNEEKERTVKTGYYFSSPTLAGTLHADSNKIQPSTKGLVIMNPGSCLHQNEAMTVGFGEDVTVSCTVPFDKAGLEEFCSSSTHKYLISKGSMSSNTFIPNWLYQHQDFVGIQGTADPDFLEEWVQISSDFNDPAFVGKSRMWNPSTKQCEGIITTSHYRFYWTHTGNVQNPQTKIISITLEHDENNPLIHKYYDDFKQHFRFTTTVSWIYVEPTDNVARLALPGLLFTVPDDVFYPFQRSKSSQGKVSANWKVLLGCICGYLYILF